MDKEGKERKGSVGRFGYLVARNVMGGAIGKRDGRIEKDKKDGRAFALA